MNTVTILLATLAIGLVATGTAYATTATNNENTLEEYLTQYNELESITAETVVEPQSNHPIINDCYQSIYDDQTNSISDKNTCESWKLADGTYRNYLSGDKIYYEQGDTIFIKAWQDPADTKRASNILIGTGTTTTPVRVIEEYNSRGDDHTLQIKLDSKYQPNTKYAIVSVYDTERASGDEAVNLEFYVMPNTDTGSPPPPPPPPPPEMTGVKGKIYTDINGIYA